MSACSLSRWLFWCRGISMTLLTVALPVRAQMLDGNGNGTSDVWELNYNAPGIDPDADSDHDGLPNRLEAIAGTDPFNALSVPRLSQITMNSNGVEVRISGVVGKHYQLQGSEALCGSTS